MSIKPDATDTNTKLDVAIDKATALLKVHETIVDGALVLTAPAYVGPIDRKSLGLLVDAALRYKNLTKPVQCTTIIDAFIKAQS